MAVTAGTLINDSLFELGVLAEGDTPTVDMSSLALRVLNRMLDTLSTNQSFAYFPNLYTWALTGESQFSIGPAVTATFTVTIGASATFTSTDHGLNIGDTVTLSTTGALPTGLTAGTTYYVISAGFTTGAFEVSTVRDGTAVTTSGTQSGTHTFVQTSSLTKYVGQRPIGIESAYLERSGIHYPVRVVDNQIFDSIIYPAASGANTVYIWYEAQEPNGILHCWPLASGCTLGIRIINQVVNFTDLVTPTILPPGYEECIVSNLCVRLAPYYPAVQLSPMIVQNAKSSLNMIQRRNNVVPTMSLPTAVTVNKGGFSLANFLSGN
jgi:hypothetical protein